MKLVKGRSYYISDSDAVLRAETDRKSAAKNHLLFGDWLRYLGEKKNGWAKVRCRGVEGWLEETSFSEERPLEINFVDIGQGDGCHIVTPDDQVILIDAGMEDNMFRFLSWRYNLRHRKVAGVDGVKKGDRNAKEPFKVDHVVVSHPDKDHYYGFLKLFESRKVAVQTIYHNGIAERPVTPAEKTADKKDGFSHFSDLGRAIKQDGETYLWDVVGSSKAMHDLLKKHKDTRKNYIATLREAVANNRKVKFVALDAADGHLPGFGQGEKVELKLLGPLTEKVNHGGTPRKCLIKLGNEGVTKNGHSVILQLRIGKLKIMLGGDLNTESEDYLLKHYAQTETETSKLEGKVYKLRAKGDTLSAAERQDLDEAEVELRSIITKGRRHFQVDVTKACHHGSHHFSETFLQVLNSIVTVISSGDNEGYSHPRPDALGSFGKYGRGVRPLIFSTELARSTKEYTKVADYLDEFKKYEADLAAAESETEKKRIRSEMEQKKDRNVAVYGMITLRTDGEKIVISQKIEAPTSKAKKWDIHELHFNENLGQFEYHSKAHKH